MPRWTPAQEACSGEGRPGFAVFPIKPASRVGQTERRIDRPGLCAIPGADAREAVDGDLLNRHRPEHLVRYGGGGGQRQDRGVR